MMFSGRFWNEQVSAVASEPEALLRRLPLAVTVHLLLLACHQAYEVRTLWYGTVIGCGLCGI